MPPASLEHWPQAQQFLRRMHDMEPSAQKAFRAIYTQAPHGEPHHPHKGHHVRQAMVAALSHPEIAYWCRLNLAVRVARKLAQSTGQRQTAQRLEQTLLAFHQAADAFMGVSDQATPYPKARDPRPTSQPEPSTISNQALRPAMPSGWFSPEDLSQIEAFKTQIIPGLVQRIRQQVRL